MSFHSEQAFYYSFFKDSLEELQGQPTWSAGLSAAWRTLTMNNVTEYPDTINALERFNIYPEVLGVARHGTSVRSS